MRIRPLRLNIFIEAKFAPLRNLHLKLLFWHGRHKLPGNLRAEASSEDGEGIKYVYLLRVRGRTGDTVDGLVPQSRSLRARLRCGVVSALVPRRL